MAEMFQVPFGHAPFSEKRDGQGLPDEASPGRKQPEAIQQPAVKSASSPELLQPMAPMSQVLGNRIFEFWFIHYGGTNNLKPGRPETQKQPLGRPEGAQVYAALSKINCGFINGNLGDPPLE